MNINFRHMLSIIALVLLQLNGNADDNAIKKLALEGIDYAGNLKYDQAAQVFDKIIEMQPDNPQGYFLKSAVYFWMFSADMHNEELGNKFKEFSDQAVDVAEKRLEENENDLDALFYLGGAYGSLGRYYGMTRSYLKAYWYGKKGNNILQDVVERDSTYYDAYLGLGIFNYLADVLPRFVKILSFILGIDGDKELGITQLNLAVEKGTYTKTEAMFFLGAIYTYREKEFDKAMVIWEKLLYKYPNNPGVLIHVARCYSDMGDCDRAIQIYEQIVDIINQTTLIPLSSVHYQLGRAYFRMNNIHEAIKSLQISVQSDTGYAGHRRWTYPWSHYFLGLSYDMLGNHEQALYHYHQVDDEQSERVYDLAQERLENPLDDTSMEIMKGRNLTGCREYEKALLVFQQIGSELIQRNDHYAHKKWSEIRYNISEVRYYQHRYKDALDILNELIEDKSIQDEWFMDWAYYMRGNCHRRLNNYEQALADYEKADNTDDRELSSRIEQAKIKLKN